MQKNLRAPTKNFIQKKETTETMTRKEAMKIKLACPFDEQLRKIENLEDLPEGPAASLQTEK